MTEEEKQAKCSEYANARICSFKYLKKTEDYYDGYFNITYLFEGNIVVSISFHLEDIEDEILKMIMRFAVYVYIKKENALYQIGLQSKC